VAVFWLVSDRVKVKAEWAQSLLLLLASGPRFNVYARRYRRAKWFFESLLGCLSTGALTKDSRSPPQTTQEASHASLRSARRLRDEKPGDLCSPAQAPRCAQRARIIGLPQRRIALTNTHRGAQQSHRSRDSRVQPPKHQSQGLPEHRTR
jgi:hypothetical protein